MEVKGKCVVCGAGIPLKRDESLRIICDACRLKRTLEVKQAKGTVAFNEPNSSRQDIE